MIFLDELDEVSVRIAQKHDRDRPVLELEVDGLGDELDPFLAQLLAEGVEARDRQAEMARADPAQLGDGVVLRKLEVLEEVDEDARGVGGGQACRLCASGLDAVGPVDVFPRQLVLLDLLEAEQTALEAHRARGVTDGDCDVIQSDSHGASFPVKCRDQGRAAASSPHAQPGRSSTLKHYGIQHGATDNIEDRDG